MTPNAKHSSANNKYSQRTVAEADKRVTGGSGCEGARGVSMVGIVHAGTGGAGLNRYPEYCLSLSL